MQMEDDRTPCKNRTALPTGRGFTWSSNDSGLLNLIAFHFSTPRRSRGMTRNLRWRVEPLQTNIHSLGHSATRFIRHHFGN
ncbi:hypothetical protein CC2G_011323 [Coprinopsis cinerea AmutBmut pab1-1]|nr:hypothetical protein CC2G_011323 [Coprinopsis cinerea AmutBmut pab1-1]